MMNCYTDDGNKYLVNCLFLFLSNAPNLARFVLRGGDWQRLSGPLRVNVLLLKTFNSMALCMR